MRKFLVIVFVVMVLAMDIKGIVNDIVNEMNEVDHIEETTTTVYME